MQRPKEPGAHVPALLGDSRQSWRLTASGQLVLNTFVVGFRQRRLLVQMGTSRWGHLLLLILFLLAINNFNKGPTRGATYFGKGVVAPTRSRRSTIGHLNEGRNHYRWNVMTGGQLVKRLWATIVKLLRPTAACVVREVERRLTTSVKRSRSWSETDPHCERGQSKAKKMHPMDALWSRTNII